MTVVETFAPEAGLLDERVDPALERLEVLLLLRGQLRGGSRRRRRPGVCSVVCIAA